MTLYKIKGPTRADIAHFAVAHAQNILPDRAPVTWLTSLPVTLLPIAPPQMLTELSPYTTDNVSIKTRTVSDVTEWYPRLQYYDVQTLEYRYISKLPMKYERIWSYVKETTSHLQNKLTKNIHLGVATSTRTPFSWKYKLNYLPF